MTLRWPLFRVRSAISQGAVQMLIADKRIGRPILGINTLRLCC